MDWIFLGQNVLYGVINGSAYLLFAIGLTLVFGVMRVINFAHGELYMLGGMLVFELIKNLGVSVIPAVLIAILAVGALGFVVNRLVIQTVLPVSPLVPLLSTLALSLVILNGAGAVWSMDPRIIKPAALRPVLRAGGFAMPSTGLIIIITGILVTIGLYLFLTRTSMGNQMRATVQNLTGAKLVGINTARVYDYAFILAAVLAAVGGILVGFARVVLPAMGQPMLMLGFVIVIVAGMGNVIGAAIIAFIIGIIESLLAVYTWPTYAPAMIYTGLVIALLARPQGVFGAARE